MWRRKETDQNPESQNQSPIGGDFDAAAARVTADSNPDAERAAANYGKSDLADSLQAGADRFVIKEEWAEGAAKLIFLPAAKFSHPAYALTDEEARKISPEIGALMQAIADRYAPALVGRVANKHPEFFDAAAAIGVLYWQKWRIVSRLQAEEAERAIAERMAARGPEAVPSPSVVHSVELPMRPGDRAADGSLVI